MRGRRFRSIVYGVQFTAYKGTSKGTEGSNVKNVCAVAKSVLLFLLYVSKYPTPF